MFNFTNPEAILPNNLKAAKKTSLNSTQQLTLTRGFHPNAKHAIHLRNDTRSTVTSSLDRPITAAGDDSVCRWHAAKPWRSDRHARNYWN